MSDILETLNKLFDISGCAVTGKAADEIRTLRAKLAEKEKPKRSGWARIVHRYPTSTLYLTKEEADAKSESADIPRIACIEIPGKPRPFDLEAAKRGEAVQKKEGFPARIVCYDQKGPWPYVVLTEHDSIESADSYADLSECLRMAPGPSRWLNVYKVWDTREEARAEGHDAVFVEF